MLALSEQSESKCARERTCTSTSLRTPAPQAGLSSKFQHPRNFLRRRNIFRSRIRALAHFAPGLARGLLADVIEFRPANPAAPQNFYFFNHGGVKRENPLHPHAFGNFPDGERGARLRAVLSCQNQALKGLTSRLVAFFYFLPNSNRVPRPQIQIFSLLNASHNPLFLSPYGKFCNTFSKSPGSSASRRVRVPEGKVSSSEKACKNCRERPAGQTKRLPA